MGNVLDQVTEKAKAAEDIQQSYMNTLHWCIAELDKAIADLVKARTDILEAAKDALTDLKEQAEAL